MDFGIVNFEDDCKEYTFWEILMWNFCCIGIPHILGCHWTYMMFGPFKQISLSPERFKTFTLVHWVIIIGILLFATFDIGVVIGVYAFSTKWPLYLIYILSIIVLVTVRHRMLRDTMNLHIHHWMLFTFLTTLFGSQTPIMTAQYAFFTGCMCEGATKYGCTPMYYMKKKLNNATPSQNNNQTSNYIAPSASTANLNKVEFTKIEGRTSL